MRSVTFSRGFQGQLFQSTLLKVPGFWEVEMELQGQKIPIYLDSSKSYLVSGSVIRLKDKKNITEERRRQLNPVDLSKIPTDDALPLGNPEAENKIVVFTDPHCSYCSKLHKVMKQAVEERSDLLFQIKLLPLKQSSQALSKTIACSQSMEQLEAAYEGKPVPEEACEKDIIEQNEALARSLGIRGTPTLVLPNGQVVSGYRSLTDLLELIDQAIENKKSRNVSFEG